jgi:hypothetical protein
MVTRDLTGWWLSEEPSPARYFVRHYTGNDDIFWAGLHESGFHRGLQFTNVFRGHLDFPRRQITGDWVDVPRGKGILHQGRLTLDVVEPAGTPPSDDGGRGRGGPIGEPPPAGGPTGGSVGTPGPQAGPELHQVVQGTTGGFSTAVIKKVPPDNFSLYPQDIGDLFNRVRRSEKPMRDDLEPLKDFAVIHGFVGGFGSTEYSYGWDDGYPQDYCLFVDPHQGPAPNNPLGLKPGHPTGDGDINFNLDLDATYRAALDQQPGFWTDWVIPKYGLLPTGAYVRSKLSETSAFHSEIVMFGREQTYDDCLNSFGGLLPGWAEQEGNSVLINGLPVNGHASRAQPGQNLPYTYFDLASPELSFRQELRQTSRIRVTGVVNIDHGHFWDPDKLEIHPVYSIDFQQDFQDPLRPPQADLSGVWHCNDVGTYYVRQVDSKVSWLGLSRDQGRTFANVFQGTIDPGTNIISGDWADVPIGVNGRRSNGRLRLRLDGSGPRSATLTATDDSQGYVGAVWQKLFDRPFRPAFALSGTRVG